MRWNGSSQPSDATNGKILGDTQVEVLSGVVANIWGGSDNLVSGRKNQGVIVGNTHVTVGTESGSEAVCQHVYGGSSFSTIRKTCVTTRMIPGHPLKSVGILM